MLLAPLPRRDSLDIQNNFADRIWTSTAESPARGLDVVDTRRIDVPCDLLALLPERAWHHEGE